MVKIIIFMIFVSFCVNSSARGIKQITINKIGASLDPSTEAISECKKFRPTKRQINKFFANAYPVDYYLSSQTFYSPCYAEGTIEYSDGNRGKWLLKSSGIAGITWEGNGEAVLFYRKNNWHDPFFGTYDDNGV